LASWGAASSGPTEAARKLSGEIRRGRPCKPQRDDPRLRAGAIRADWNITVPSFGYNLIDAGVARGAIREGEGLGDG